jgi:tetratricopeptide (TPR) repeat protein
MIRVLAGVLLLFFPLVTALAQVAPAKADQPSMPAQNGSQATISNVTPQTTTKDAGQAGPAQAPTPPDYSQEAYVVEHYSESMRFENDGTGVIQTDAQIKITSESGVQALGQLKVGYSALSDKLEIPYVRVHKPDGTVVTAQESAIQDLTFPDAPVYTDYHEKHISVPSLRPGDVLEYRFVRTIATALAPGQFWTSFNFAGKGIILDERLEINVPKGRQIKLKTKPGYDAKITDDGDRRVYVWTHSRLTDDDADSKKKKKKPHKDDDEVPTVQLTTYKSWEEFGAWYAGLERERRVPDATVKAEAATLVKGKTDDMAKVKALYDYVSRNIRYVSLSFGLGRYQPHAASEVLANGYGDCKDKNTLLAALLDAEGFHSTSVLIGAKLKLDPDVPSPSQFDHVITRVPVGGKEIWLDSTPGVAPFRMLSPNLRDKQALAILPDGNAQLVWTPTDLPFPAYDRSVLVGTVSDNGKLTAHFTMAGRGDSELMLRFAMRRMPSSHWKDIFQYVLERSGMHDADITNLKATDPSATDDPLQVDFDLAVNNYFDWSAAESKLVLPLSMIGMPDESDEDSDTSSTDPIKFGAAQAVEEDQKLTFPSKYKLHPPIGVDVKRSYAQYRSTYKYEGSEFNSKRTLDVLVGEIPRDRVEDYDAFRRVVLADQAQQLTLENTQPGTGAGTTAQNQSAEELNDAGVQALNNGKYQVAIDLFQQVVKLEPKHKSAWNALGSAYLGLGNTGQAIPAFQAQLAINPYDQYAYNNLGEAYVREAKYDQGIQQFQKQLEVNPLDAAAHANLGRVYLDQKKYAEAVPELEKAADLQPKNPVVETELGQAYIATGQTDKGMAAFENAIRISPAPLVWNNVAYSLSEQNVQLERASEYADTAIKALETQLRDVKLDNLRMQDLGASELLFSVWDTKGWIEYKRGNTDVAEQFIGAAWQAGGSGDEAEHLGEISEKLDHRDAAVNYYLQSLATENPAFDARARLTALSVKDIDPKVAKARPEIQRERTIPLTKSDKGTAEFYLLISPTKIEQVKFIKGDDSLKSLADVLQKTDVGMKFPPNAQAHVVRRAIVQCGTTAPAPCTLELIPSAEVRTLE